MIDETEVFTHNVPFCEMTYFPQVGLLLNAMESSWEKETLHFETHSHIRDRNDPGHPILRTVFGYVELSQKVREWLAEQGFEYQLKRTSCNWNSECQGAIWFKEPGQAMLFKLTWGGNVPRTRN